MKNICAKCQASFQVKKMAVSVVETAGTPPKPIRIWRADLHACPICSAEIVTNFAHAPMIESHETGFAEALEAIPQDHKHILYSPEYLAQTVIYATRYVRSYDKRNLRTTDR